MADFGATWQEAGESQGSLVQTADLAKPTGSEDVNKHFDLLMTLTFDLAPSKFNRL